jgi:FixJ family two-component response regulator
MDSLLLHFRSRAEAPTFSRACRCYPTLNATVAVVNEQGSPLEALCGRVLTLSLHCWNNLMSSNVENLVLTNIYSAAPMVYVVDDDAGVRRAVAALMRSVDLHVETFAKPEDFLSRLGRSDGPACLVLDVRLRGKNGLTFHQELLDKGLRVPVIFITGHGDIEMCVKAMKAGALDFFAKPFRDQDLLDAVSRALAGEEARVALDAFTAELRACYASLSPREKQVLELVVSGLLNKQIAAQLSLSEITVKVHRGQALRKLKARSMPDLIRKAELLGVRPRAEPSRQGVASL